MKAIIGNIWDFHNNGDWICITTNGTIKKNGEAVMGRGCALQAKQKYNDLPKRLADSMKLYGNTPIIFLENKIISFPVKHNWYEKADINLIENSAKHLLNFADHAVFNKIYIPRPGCGNGRLDFCDVKPILEKYFDDRFIICDHISEIGEKFV